MDGSGRYSAHLGHPHNIKPGSTLWWYRSSGTVHKSGVHGHGEAWRLRVVAEPVLLELEERDVVRRHASP